MSDKPNEEGSEKPVDFKKLELQFKDLLRREERGELSEKERADLEKLAEERGQPLHDFLWCMRNIASEYAKNKGVRR